MIALEADISDTLAMLAQCVSTFNPEGTFVRVVPLALNERMHKMQEEAFESQGDGSWPALSGWTTEERGADGPILDDTGAFRSIVSEFVGMWSATPDAFTYIYPGLFQGEGMGQYFGITAGQRVNPLRKGRNPYPIPMANVPRPILFGGERLLTDVNAVLEAFMLEAGFISDPVVE